MSPADDAAAEPLTPVLHLTALGLVLRGTQSLISLINLELLAHALGPSGRGEYFLFVAAVAVLARVCDLGMSPSAVVFGGQYPRAFARLHRWLISSVVVLWLAVLAIGALVLTFTAEGLGDLPRERLWLGLLVLPLAMYEQVWIHLMVGIRRVVTMNVVQLVAGVATLAANLAFVVLAPGGVAAATLIFCGVLLLKTPVMALLAWRPTSGVAPSVESEPTPREIVSFSLRGYPNALASLLWSRLPAFVLDLTQGSSAVGIFSVAQQALEQLMLPVQAAQDAIYQDMTRLPRAAATPAMNRYLRTGLWAMLPVYLVCGALAPWGMPLVFGDAFAPSAHVFQILLISLLASVVPALLSPYFVGHLRRPALASSMGWIRVLLALGLSLLLAPGLAELGVASALAIADTCSTLLLLILYVRIASTPMAQAILPQWADFAGVLRRVPRP